MIWDELNVYNIFEIKVDVSAQHNILSYLLVSYWIY